MKNTEITIEDIRNLSESERHLLDVEMKMNDKQLDLLFQIVNLMAEIPNSAEFVRTWTGKIADLPAALAQI